MQQVFAESWPFRSTGYIAARIHIDRANLIGDEIHHHLVLASEKYDAMTTCCPQPLGPIVVRLPKNCFSINEIHDTMTICDKNMQQDRSFVILSYWRPCVPGHWQTIGIKTPKMNSKSALATFTGNRTCTSKSKVCSKSLWPSSKMQHTVPKHMFFFPFGA